ncbi:YcaO-like family protein [Legionella genomosp. 1]|uniref:YcaO-like family protein n=1 Tax=Legionella genomosp. 1 TaxID=1093625 RepID=UPI0010552363|nr:YcaO-like family protein [Legionella genomosp. 1]
MNYERQMPSRMALEKAKSTLNLLNLQADLQQYGTEIKTSHCKLTDNQSHSIFYGCGKGIGIQSIVSACFEALEHYAVFDFCQKHQNNYFSLSNPLIADPLKTHQLLAPQIYQETAEMPFARFAEISTGEILYYPLYLIDPRYAKSPAAQDIFNYEPYSWQACDSGIASGTSEEEASIHALNEAIERDAYSLFLIQAFMLHAPVSIIDKNSVPEYLKEMINQIEREYDEELLLVDITSDIGIPSVLVSLTKQSMPVQPIGCGTSLYKDYALERALLESLQPLHLFNDHLLENQQKTLGNLAEKPLLAQCAKADIASLSAQFQIKHFDSLPDYKGASSLNHQLETIIQSIRKQNFSIYKTNLAELDSGFHCVKYIIPGLEQFYLVEIGKHILPNTRGMNFIRNRQATVSKLKEVI